jgi:FtsH-binding integral membrane protein
MITYFTSSLPVLALLALAIILIVFGGLVFYALRTKGDVFAELSHRKNCIQI